MLSRNLGSAELAGTPKAVKVTSLAAVACKMGKEFLGADFSLTRCYATRCERGWNGLTRIVCFICNWMGRRHIGAMRLVATRMVPDGDCVATSELIRAAKFIFHLINRRTSIKWRLTASEFLFLLIKTSATRQPARKGKVRTNVKELLICYKTVLPLK